MDIARARAYIDSLWDSSILPTLVDYIRIPNKSPAFDFDWQAHGYMEQAVVLFESWCRQQAIQDMEIQVIRLPERTPLLYIDIPGSGADTVLLYGHLDKQPEMTGWRDGLGPWTPVLEDNKLYGRGGADDGYAIFAALSAIGALQEQGTPHARCVVLIECSEESGSLDLPAYIEHLLEAIGEPSLVICLDSGCGNYQQLWCTTSLRGLITADLQVEVLSEGVHSGDAGGIVPSSFRIARQLLSRLEDSETGEILPDALAVEIPDERRAQAIRAALALGEMVFRRFPFTPGTRPARGEPAELVLNRTWRAALEITGAAGLPSLKDAGNVARPSTTLRLSLRLPPTCYAITALEAIKSLLTQNPPQGAKVTLKFKQSDNGWHSPPCAPWLTNALEQASQAWFGKEALYMGEGGSIPFMNMLGQRFPKAQFLVTGVLGPGANAHGPNEFLHIPTARNVTGCVAQVLAAQYGSNRR
ncbi:MAG: M20 family metallopeptidase [Gammaproteobacteria bacterium]|nr:M20 family metallopeptidase [Gammaproteobacteria bacterium]MCP5458100.1 M20 family metallopeptidase [Gammaproteobacteria bacterium]